MKTLTLGYEPNKLELVVENMEIKPWSRRDRVGIRITLINYNLEDVLCQLLEDYGEEKLIEEMKAL